MVDENECPLDSWAPPVANCCMANTINRLIPGPGGIRVPSESSSVGSDLWLDMAERVTEMGRWHYDIEAKDLTWSEHMFRIYGLDPNPGAPSFEDMVESCHPDDRASFREAIEGMRVAGEARLEMRVVRPGGEIRLVEVIGRSQSDASGRTVSLLGVFLDLTERRRLEQTLLQSERMVSLGTLSSAIAHEINNPLTYILANVDVLTTELATRADRNQMEMLIEARRGAEQVRKIVHGLKAFSQIGSHTIEAIDIAETLDVALRMVGNEVRHRAELLVQTEELPAVSGDPSELLQVLTNLLVNAAQAVPDDGEQHTVSVVGAVRDDRVMIEIRDTGIGLPSGQHTRVFEPFFTTKPQGVGTGLGLSVSLGIIERMGGSIELVAAPDRGTIARVMLPPSEQSKLDRGVEDSAVPLRARVVLIDDDPRVGRAMKRMLSRSYDVTAFDDARKALDHLVGSTADVILCDVMMPGYSGVQVYRDLKSRRPDLAERLVFMTGGAFGSEARDGLRGVMNPILEKPVDFKALQRIVNEGRA